MGRADTHVNNLLWGLRLFCFALMGSACAINAVFIALAVPAMAAFGQTGLIAAGAVGALIGIVPAQWLASRIYAGINDRADD